MEDKKMKRAYKIIILSLIFGFIGGAIGTSFMFQFNEKIVNMLKIFIMLKVQ